MNISPCDLSETFFKISKTTENPYLVNSCPLSYNSLLRLERRTSLESDSFELIISK